MAYTEPRTWTDGELVTAAILNTDHRDNMRAMGPHLVVRKTADESVVSSAALQDDNDLIMPVGAGEIWRYEFIALAEGAFDIQFGFSFPSGTLSYQFAAATSTASAFMTGGATTSSPTASLANININDTPNYTPVFIRGVFVGGSAGNVTLRWAQLASGGVATTIKANSTLWAMKLA